MQYLSRAQSEIITKMKAGVLLKRDSERWYLEAGGKRERIGNKNRCLELMLDRSLIYLAGEADGIRTYGLWPEGK